MKYNFITKEGKILSCNKIEVFFSKMTWEKLHQLSVKGYFLKSESDFLKKYGLDSSLFNVACLQRIGAVPLTESDLIRLREELK
jgi:hypothetical protein